MGCRYAEIQMVCVPLLVSALRNDTPEKTTWTGLCEIIESHFKGDLRHAADTLLLLWKSVSQDSDTSAIVSDGTPSVCFFSLITVEADSELSASRQRSATS